MFQVTQLCQYNMYIYKLVSVTELLLCFIFFVPPILVLLNIYKKPKNLTQVNLNLNQVIA